MIWIHAVPYIYDRSQDPFHGESLQELTRLDSLEESQPVSVDCCKASLSRCAVDSAKVNKKVMYKYRIGRCTGDGFFTCT